MRSVSALDIMARWLAGSAAGIALLLVVPDDVFGPEPIIHFLSFLPTTRAHLIGLSVIVAAWVMFIVHLWQARGGLGSRLRSPRHWLVLGLVAGLPLLLAGLLYVWPGSAGAIWPLVALSVLAGSVLAYRQAH